MRNLCVIEEQTNHRYLYIFHTFYNECAFHTASLFNRHAIRLNVLEIRNLNDFSILFISFRNICNAKIMLLSD